MMYIRETFPDHPKMKDVNDMPREWAAFLAGFMALLLAAVVVASAFVWGMYRGLI
jgi:hypothetical protein